MAPFSPFVASLDFTHASDLSEAATRFVADRSILIRLVQEYWEDFTVWLSQPSVFAVLIVWAASFTVVTIVVLGLGFGPAGIAAGSTAAGFQSWMYGGFTPAAGIFATLTSLGMLGLLMPAVAAFAGCVATVLALVAWACGIGG